MNELWCLFNRSTQFWQDCSLSVHLRIWFPLNCAAVINHFHCKHFQLLNCLLLSLRPPGKQSKFWYLIWSGWAYFCLKFTPAVDVLVDGRCAAFLSSRRHRNGDGLPCICLILFWYGRYQPHVCVCVWGESLWLHNSCSLVSVCRTDKSISNDKMRLTLNLGDDAMYPAGHPLSPCFLDPTPLRHGEEEWRGKNADKQKWLCSVSTWCDRRPMFVAIDGPRCHGKSIPLVSPQTIATAIARWERAALEMNVWACVSAHTSKPQRVFVYVFIYLLLTTLCERLIRLSNLGLDSHKDLLPHNADRGMMGVIIRLRSIRRESSHC